MICRQRSARGSILRPYKSSEFRPKKFTRSIFISFSFSRTSSHAGAQKENETHGDPLESSKVDKIDEERESIRASIIFHGSTLQHEV